MNTGRIASAEITFVDLAGRRIEVDRTVRASQGARLAAYAFFVVNDLGAEFEVD